jgi:NitT/TauT family transport system substrate-binding protein
VSAAGAGTRGRFLASSSAAALAALACPAIGAAAVPLRVGSALIEAQAQAHYALDMGFFKANNLDVEVVTSNNGAASAAAVAGGDLQIAVTSVLGLAQAVNRGLPFSIIAPGGIHDSRYPGSGLFVAANSAVQSPKDLNGKTIGVGTLKGLDQLMTCVLIDKVGGDASSLKFLELKPVSMVDTLESGRVDAAFIDNPEYSFAKGRARLIGDGEDALAKSFVETVWFANRDWLAKNADTARRFREAIYAAGSWAMANPEPAGAVLVRDLKVQYPKASVRFADRHSITTESYQVLLNAGTKYSYIPPTKAEDLLWDPA